MGQILTPAIDALRQIQTPALPKPAHLEIAELRLALARAEQRNADLIGELQLAVDECCNDYWIKGHGDRVQRLYGVANRTVTTPDVMDTVRLAHAALTGKADAKQAIAQCARAYGEVIGIAL